MIKITANTGNPRNNYSARGLAELMVKLALTYTECQATALRVKLTHTTANAYCVKGYQDVPTGDCEHHARSALVTTDWHARWTQKRVFDAYAPMWPTRVGWCARVHTWDEMA